jgi:serine/threonine-protein kinase SRPK3
MTTSLPQEPVKPTFKSYGYHSEFYDYNIEDLDRYRPGGLHPIIIGDALGPNRRFTVFHKLGHGGYGTVWLCRDTERNKWKAVKVLAASESTDKNRQSGDLAILQHFDGVSRSDLEAHHICLPEEHFWQEGPNGKHLCLVLPVLDKSVISAWDDFAGDCPDELKHICAQMCLAMKLLHSRNVYHGDFRPQNILYKIDGLEDLSEQEVVSMIRKTEALPVGPIPGTTQGPGPHLPPFVYEASKLRLPSNLMTNDIMVVDFGEAYHVSKPPSDNGIPHAYAAPEILLKTGLVGFAADIWALGTCFSEIRLGCPPFSDDGIIACVETLENILGPLPDPYRSAWFRRGYRRRGSSLVESLPPTEPVSLSRETLDKFKQERLEEDGYSDYLERMVRSKTRFAFMDPNGGPGDDGDGLVWHEIQVAAEEADLFLPLLKTIFNYQQEERPLVTDIMRHPWFEGVFLPEALNEHQQETTDDDQTSSQPCTTNSDVSNTTVVQDSEARFAQQTVLGRLHHGLGTITNIMILGCTRWVLILSALIIILSIACRCV